MRRIKMPANRATSGVIWAIISLMEVSYAAVAEQRGRATKPGVPGAA
jgi:hypothetical protein